jgi:hypothetical protein
MAVLQSLGISPVSSDLFNIMVRIGAISGASSLSTFGLILSHGFRNKRSCETQLLEFVDDVSSNLSSGKQTDVLVKDFSKAFD